MKQKEVIILLSSLFFLIFFLSLVKANWMILDSNRNEIEDRDIITGNKIEIALTEEETPYFLYQLIKGEESGDSSVMSKLCVSCKSNKDYYKTISVSNNKNYILKIVNGNDEENETTFEVDNKKPQIKQLTPGNIKYINGEFKIRVIEKNLDSDSVLLFTKKNSDNWEMNTMSCTEINEIETDMQECSFDFNGNEGEKYKFYYKATDSAGNSIKTNEKETLFDNEDPEIDIISPIELEEVSKSFPLSIATNEKTSIYYNVDNIENNNGELKYNKICQKCTFGTKRINSGLGTHIIKIKAIDDAGNVDEKEISVHVDD